MTEQIKTQPKKILKYIPWAGLLVLTAGLMIIFKLTDQGYNSLQTQGENILSKYTESLSPLFSKTRLTDEDVFNFALYNKLPLDKENKKILNIESDSYGNENINVISTESDFDTKNYNLFKDKLRLTNEEQLIIDSLIKSYKNDLYAAILQSEKDVVAIDPKIGLLRKSLSAEIYEFALNKVNTEKGKTTQKILAENYNDRFADDLNTEKIKLPKEFIVLAPDTVFSTKVASAASTNAAEAQMLEKFNADVYVSTEVQPPVLLTEFPDIYETIPIPDFDFHYATDSISKKLIIPSELFSRAFYDAYDSLEFKLDNLSDELNRMDIEFGTSENTFNFSISTETESELSELKLDLDFNNLGKFIGNTIEMALQSASDQDWEKFGYKMDSLSQVIADFENDSAAIIKLKMLSEELKKRKKNNATKSKDSGLKNNN